MKALGERNLIVSNEDALKKLRRLQKDLGSLEKKLEEAVEWATKVGTRTEDYIEKRVEEATAPLLKRLEELEGIPKVSADQVALSRAKTFAIVDSILFAIENWATDASPAPDITLASQATLFPVFLEEVSRGDENYYLTRVPDSAIEVVRRGREFVKNFREKEQISVLDPHGWDILQPVLHEWWTRDAMPLLYGASLAEWQHETPYSRDQMMKWKDLELSRAMDFPLIFDGYELVSRYGDEIRVETGLPEFNKQIMQTRFTVNG